MNPPPRGVRVLLWRHGRTAFNHGHRWQGQRDIPLDEVGQEQAARAARALAKSVDGVPLRLVSSDLGRARATADALATLVGADVVTDPRLREIDAGDWEGLTRDEISAAGMDAELEAWARGEDVRIGRTGERRSEVGRRGATAVAEHVLAVPEGGTLVVASHGGVLRGAVLGLLGLDPSTWNTFGPLGNCHWAELMAGTRREGASKETAMTWRLFAYNVPPPDHVS